MIKIFKYLQTIGIEEKPARGNYNHSPAEFVRQLCGDDSYFYNAPNFTYYRAVITWNYREATPESVQDFTRQEKQLKTYCKKYGYILDARYFYGDRIATITKETDAAAADNYFYFRDASAKEWEQMQHEYIQAGRQNEINAATLEIMNKYGELYNEFLRNTEEKTA